MRLVASRNVSVLLFVVAATACGGTREETDSASSEAALRALSSSEVVGSISYGETKSGITYDDGPTYRALSFQATAGDEVTIEVRAAGADAKAWLLADDFRTVSSNDDAASTTRDSRIAKKMTKSGAYYIAFREKNYEDAAFDVSLQKAGPVVSPPEPQNAAVPSSGCDSRNGGFHYFCKGPFQHTSGPGYAVWASTATGFETCFVGCADGWDYYNDPPMPLWACEKSIHEHFCR